MKHVKNFEGFINESDLNEKYSYVVARATGEFNDISISFSNTPKKGSRVESLTIPSSANWLVFHSMGGDDGSVAYNSFPEDFMFNFYSAGSPEEALKNAEKDYVEETGRNKEDFEDEMVEIWDLKTRKMVNIEG